MTDQIKPILLVVNADYDYKKMAERYVEELNKISQTIISKYKVRFPTENEIAQFSRNRQFKRVGNSWRLEAEEDGKKISKIAFVIDPVEQRLIPDELFKARKKSLSAKLDFDESCKRDSLLEIKKVIQ